MLSRFELTNLRCCQQRGHVTERFPFLDGCEPAFLAEFQRSLEFQIIPTGASAGCCFALPSPFPVPVPLLPCHCGFRCFVSQPRCCLARLVVLSMAPVWFQSRIPLSRHTRSTPHDQLLMLLLLMHTGHQLLTAGSLDDRFFYVVKVNRCSNTLALLAGQAGDSTLGP